MVELIAKEKSYCVEVVIELEEEVDALNTKRVGRKRTGTFDCAPD